MDESISNRDKNCHQIKLETIKDRITSWICASIISIQGSPLFNRHAIMQSKVEVTQLSSLWNLSSQR